MKKLRWPLLIVLLALVAIAVLLASQPNSPILPIDIIDPPEEVKPVVGGIYAEGLIGSYHRLNPVLDTNHPADRDIDRLLYSGLVRFDDHGLPVGDLAESYGISTDGKVYNFSIRENAVWHDGEPVTSEDIAFTIELLKEENSLMPADVRELWNEVQVNLLADNSIQFRLSEPFAPFMDYLTFGVLPEHLLGGTTFEELIDSDFNLKPVGSGPFAFNSLIVESGEVKGVALKAFEDYYGQKPNLDQFVFRYYPDAQSMLDAYRSGEILGLSQVSEEILPAVLSEPNLDVYTGRLPQVTMVFLNLNNPDVPFLQDASIRRAMLMALNRQRYVDHLFNSQAIVADGPIFPGTWAFYDGIEHVTFDQSTAVNLIKEAGYTFPADGGTVRVNEEGVRLELDLVYPDEPRYESLAQAIQKDWEELGMGVNITPVSYEVMVGETLPNRLFHATLTDINLANSPDPDPYPFWHQTQKSSGQNYSQWDDFQASEYLERARIVAQLGDRTTNYKNFQVRFTQELPSLPLFYPVYTYAVDSRLHGVTLGPLFDRSDRFVAVTGWGLLEEAPIVQVREIIATPTP